MDMTSKFKDMPSQGQKSHTSTIIEGQRRKEGGLSGCHSRHFKKAVFFFFFFFKLCTHTDMEFCEEALEIISAVRVVIISMKLTSELL